GLTDSSRASADCATSTADNFRLRTRAAISPADSCQGAKAAKFAIMNPPARFTLYTGPLSMFGAKAQIAALEKGLDFELVMVPFDFDALYTPKHPEVLRINPKRQVPVLVHGDLEIFDSTQIFEYLED